MITALLFAAVLPLSGTAVDWSQVDINMRKLDSALAPATLSAREVKAIRPHLIHSLGEAWPGCGSGADNFFFYRTPLGPDVLKVEGGPGGCRGGQGSNGALWLIRRQGPTWQVLASPADGFSGWGLGLQSHRTQGLPDLVVGWHMGADDFTLSYFRFDGHRYHRISGMDFKPCNRQTETYCFADGQRARNTGARY